MKDKRPSLIKLINILYRCTQAHTDEVLEKFQLSSGTYPFILALKENEGICQNQICRDLNVDKAMSARSIKKLIELGYITKEENTEDSRAYKLYLTEKAKKIIPEIISELQHWIDTITEGIPKEETDIAINVLGKALYSAKAHRHNTKER